MEALVQFDAQRLSSGQLLIVVIIGTKTIEVLGKERVPLVY